MPKGITETRLYGRNDIVDGPFLFDDGLVVGAHRQSMSKFDRRTLKQRVWETVTPVTGPVDVVGEIILAAGGRFAEGYMAIDGRRAWTSEGSAAIRSAGNFAAIVNRDALEIRTPASGEIVRTVKLPWRGTGAALSCGNALLVNSDSSKPGATTAEEQRLCAVVRDSGALLWDRALGRECNALLPPAVEGELLRALRPVYTEQGALVVRFGPALFRLNAATGDILWKAPVELDLLELTVVNGRAYVPRSHGLTIVDMETGKVLADHEPPELQGVSRPRPGVVRGDRIAFPCQSGHVVVHDLDGNVVNVRKANARFWSGVEADGRLILAGSGALVVCDESIWGHG